MIGAGGYLAFDIMGTVVAVLAWPALLLMWHRMRWVSVAWRSPPVREPATSVYRDIEDIIDSLDDVARERSWDFAKRLAIARLACESRTAPITELEQRYDRERQAALDASGSRDLSEHGGGSR